MTLTDSESAHVSELGSDYVTDAGSVAILSLWQKWVTDWRSVKDFCDTHRIERDFESDRESESKSGVRTETVSDLGSDRDSVM